MSKSLWDVRDSDENPIVSIGNLKIVCPCGEDIEIDITYVGIDREGDASASWFGNCPKCGVIISAEANTW